MKWKDNECRYCLATGELEEYTCPECERKGCPICMETGSEVKCSYCVEEEEYIKKCELMFGKPQSPF